MWLLLELVMPPKKPKISTDKAGPSAAIAIATEVEVALRNDAATAMEPPAPQPQMDNTAAPGVREQTLEGDVEEVEIDQNGDEIEEDEDGEITEQARNSARNKAEQTQRAIREAEIQRDRLVREIQGLQGAGAGGVIHAGGSIVILGDNPLEEDESAYDPTSSLSKEL
jgi:hypothetical protein